MGISMPWMLGMSALQVAHSSCSGPRKCSGSTRKLRPRVALSRPAVSRLLVYEVTIHLSTGLELRRQLRRAAGKLKAEVQLMLTLSPGR